jgi:hypothetical protein
VLDDVANGPDEFAIRVPLEISDPDGDEINVEILVADEEVVRGYWQPSEGQVILEPLASGRSSVTVHASDGVATTSRAFSVTIGEVTRRIVLSAAGSAAAVTLLNAGASSVDFDLVHNGNRNFASIAEIVDHVQAMTAQVPGEGFPRRLWRFVRDNVYHWPYLGPDTWLMNPLVTINSLGWGLCSSVAATYVEIARAAGYEARIWALNGHVVAEVKRGQSWLMFDPDLAVYYLGSGGDVVGVSALEQDTTLITSPYTPIFASGGYATPYAPEIAAIYGTVTDNAVWSVILPTPVGQSGRLVLPPGARLTYPGQWTAAPVGREDNGAGFEVPVFAQAAMDLPAGWGGSLPMPWIPWEITGDGVVEVQGQVFAAGSPDLRDWLQGAAAPIREVRIAAAGDVRIVFLVNPLRYEMAASNDIAVTGLHVWQLDVGTATLRDNERMPGPFPDGLRKPTPLES